MGFFINVLLISMAHFICRVIFVCSATLPLRGIPRTLKRVPKDRITDRFTQEPPAGHFDQTILRLPPHFGIVPLMLYRQKGAALLCVATTHASAGKGLLSILLDKILIHWRNYGCFSSIMPLGMTATLIISCKR